MKNKKVNTKKLVIINIILLICSLLVYKYIFDVETGKIIYQEETVKFVENNENPVFKIGQVILYNSATAIDNSEGELKNLDISQFTDIEVYIDNKAKTEELTGENTINQLYINNIKVENNFPNGEKILNYKNPLNCGKYVELENWRDDGILFNVVNTNEKNKSANYEENIFYTDCSNPISLGYINKNILTNCEINNEVGTINFDGSLLRTPDINLNDLKTSISFSINIVNNLNEKFVCNLTIDNDLNNEEIYSGNMMKILNFEEDKYNFIKISD